MNLLGFVPQPNLRVGGYLITDAGKNQTQFAQGITTESLENQLSYQGSALQGGINISQSGISSTGLGYGKIDPVNKTSTTHSAITDQAGLNHINTENFNQAEVQSELNEIIDNSFNQEQALKELNAQVTITQAFDTERRAIRSEFAKKNDFDKEQALKELNAQVNITTEFGREAPKQIGDYAQTKELELLAQGNIEEAKKWAEGGIYRVALHTTAGLLATGTIEGTVSAGTTAYTIPKIDEYLKEQGFDATVRHSALLALSAGLGASIGDSTASTINTIECADRAFKELVG